MKKLASFIFLIPICLNAADVTPSVATRFSSADTQASPDFQKHVVPLLGKLGCNSAKCHGSFQGQGGFSLSLFGYNFQADHAELLAEATSEEGNRLQFKQPEKSLVLMKPTEQTDHEGGQRFEINSWEHNLLLRWIQTGAKGAEQANAQKKPRKDAATDEVNADGKAFFKQKIQPLFEDHCYECHGFNNLKGDLSLASRDQMLEGGESGPAIVSGKPDESRLIHAVRQTSDDLKMPPSGKLKAEEISDLEAWVKMGAPWSDEVSVEDIGQTLVALHCEPSEIVFEASKQETQIRVIAEWKNGELEDVTSLTRFQTNNDVVATVDQGGLTVSQAAGDTHVVAFYDNGVTAIPVLRRFDSKGTRPIARKTSKHPIDRFVNAKLDKLGLIPSDICTDAEFLRRVSIDMTGTLPTPDEVTAFLADQRDNKRIRKIDELLNRTTYAAWWANKLCDFTGCNPKSIRSLLEVAVEDGYVKASAWYDWIFERVARNEPYDKLVEGIMLSNVSAANAKRLNTDAKADTGMPYFWTRQSLQAPKDTAMSVAHAFLGIQLQCAECHKHPFDQWTQADFASFSKFFDTVTRTKRRSNVQKSQDLSLLRSGIVKLKAGDDPRKPIMDWMRDRQNPWFARAFVNRVWAGYFHIGIVDPPDQFTPANPASNPELLEWLTQGFIDQGYDMKWLHRQITSSETYQRSWKPNATNREDRRNFSRAIPRRIPAEVVYDAMKQATAAKENQERVRTNLQRRASGHLSMRMAGTHAMKVFGKPDRSINCDCERVNEPTLLQAIFVQNDPLVRMRLADSSWIIQIEDDLAAGKTVDKQLVVHQVWLRTVNRPPTEKEIKRAIAHLDSVDSLPEGITDLMWAMLNTKEFLLNH